ncbi:MAG: site-2 protease family protein [Clostridia bacterium]|nr:site-2 protease family protein [Clostridia bacterium]MBQ3077774.1 site-2 protease family protein [Clostridia bacterium]
MQRFLQDAIYLIPAVLFSLSFHEFFHGFVADRLGDPTARNQGRLTLNPKAHLDPIGTVCMLLFRFGWAKPVPVNMMYFKNPKQGMAITAAAGPASNLLLAFGSMALYFVFAIRGGDGLIGGYLTTFFYIMILINVGLAVFNLLPISPLDGSKILYAVLPNQIYFKIMQYEQYFQPIIFLLLWTGLLSTPLGFLRDLVIDGMSFVLRPLVLLLL